MQASLDPSSANKRRRVPIKIIEPPSVAASATSSAVPAPGPSKPQESPVVESSSHAVQPPSLNARTDTLEPISSRSLKLPATDTSARSSKVSLTTTEKDLPDDSPSRGKPLPTSTLGPPANGASKPNSFKDAKQARENVKSSRVGGGIFRASGSNTVFTPRDNGNPTLADLPKSDSSMSTQNDDSTVPAPKVPNTLFDFVKSWSSLRSTEGRWQLINVSIFSKVHDSSDSTS